ncbi:MAG: glycosyltransferase, partial [Paracoccaceae bacterium]
GSVSCYEAYRAGRPYAVWTDRVESEVVRRTADTGPWRQRLKARLTHRPMAWLERHLIRRAALGLFHGKETFDTYAPFCRQPVVVHDIHINKSEHIPDTALQAKIAAAGAGPLKIGYVGRADAMKGPMDWVAVLEALAAAGVDFEAFWMGDGPFTEKMQSRIDTGGLADRVKLLGFVRDRAEVLRRFRAAQVFLFCHKTPESPRCLIEALISGTPIVGYDGSFASDLISGHQGGRLVSLDDVAGLKAALAELAGDRAALAALIAGAAKDGAPFDDESVFRHRSEVIRQYLGPETG